MNMQVYVYITEFLNRLFRKKKNWLTADCRAASLICRGFNSQIRAQRSRVIPAAGDCSKALIDSLLFDPHVRYRGHYCELRRRRLSWRHLIFCLFSQRVLSSSCACSWKFSSSPPANGMQWLGSTAFGMTQVHRVHSAWDFLCCVFLAT